MKKEKNRSRSTRSLDRRARNPLTVGQSKHTLSGRRGDADHLRGGDSGGFRETQPRKNEKLKKLLSNLPFQRKSAQGRLGRLQESLKNATSFSSHSTVRREERHFRPKSVMWER